MSYWPVCGPPLRYTGTYDRKTGGKEKLSKRQIWRRGESTRVEHLGFRPYSLRRGGATQAFRETGNMPAVLEKGRWAHTRTASTYLNDGLARLAQLLIPADKQLELQRLCAELLQ